MIKVTDSLSFIRSKLLKLLSVRVVSMKNKSADISWIDADIIRFRREEDLIPKIQRKAYEKISNGWTKDKTVIDIGCSIGVGSNILSHHAKRVLGVDINQEAIDFATIAFQRPNLDFLVLDIEKPIFSNKESCLFDIIVMLETLEHLVNYERGLENFRSFFHQDSIGFISIPNINDPKDASNQYHLHHWTMVEFYKLLSQYFTDIVFYVGEELKELNTKFISRVSKRRKGDLVLSKVTGLK